VVLEKEVFCWIGPSRDGRRKGGGMCWALEDLSSLLATGRMAMDVDMAH
jgi:hypothetical protein